MENIKFQMITVIKQDYSGRETFRYQGKLLSLFPHKIIISAHFDRQDTPVEGITLKQGDLFIESYFDNRWYNIFEIHDQDSERIKGWYCNIGHPAIIQIDSIAYRDLALDLLVYPDGQQKVLDREEFTTLPLSPQVKASAEEALTELEQKFKARALID
jgi:protein associated with RNAse G/E